MHTDKPTLAHFSTRGFSTVDPERQGLLVSQIRPRAQPAAGLAGTLPQQPALSAMLALPPQPAAPACATRR
jgi:hypothetical protein